MKASVSMTIKDVAFLAKNLGNLYVQAISLCRIIQLANMFLPQGKMTGGE